MEPSNIIFTLNDLPNVLSKCWGIINGYRIIAFNGEMGAGKTTFISHLCNYVGVTDSVSSPTFALINEYHFFQNKNDCTIFHMDWYRLNSNEEAIQAGVEDCLLQAVNNTNTFCFIEWPQRAAGLLPKGYLQCHIETIDNATRNITFTEVS